MANTLSDEGIAAIVDREGLRIQVYPDSSCPPNPTIGVGHKLTQSERSNGKILIGDKWVKYAGGLTLDQCHELLRQDTEDAANYVAAVVKVTLAQHQFDALVSFCMNVGKDAFWNAHRQRSTLVRKLNAWDFDGAANEFPKWKYDNGHVVAGLVKRRKSERAQFLG